MDENQNIIGQLMESFRSLPADRKAIITICAVIFVAALIFWVNSVGEPEYALLYGDLTLDDSGNIVNELQTRNISYKLTDGGRDVWVPVDQRDNTRVDLAMGDLLPSGSVGFELFDKSNIGLSEFTQNVNKQRATQGELERTLKTIEGVELARVHINMPEQSPFMEDSDDVTASVMLKLSGRTQGIGAQKVLAIQNLVATAVGGLEPDGITIIDNKANLLTRDQMGLSDYAGLPDRYAVKREFETLETEKIKRMLEKRFGMYNVAVGVSVDMDFDQVEKETKIFTSEDGTGKGILTKEESEESKVKGEGVTSPGGVPGTTTNVPGYPGVAGGTYDSQTSSESKEYAVSEAWEKTIIAQGDIKKMSVSVLINQEEEDAVIATQVVELVTAAANLDTVRGDVVSVKMMPFDVTLQTKMDEWFEEEGKSTFMAALLKWLPTGLVLAVVLFFFFRLMKPIKGGYQIPRAEELIEEEIELPEGDPEAIKKAKMRDEISRIAEQDPSSTARIIKTWLAE